MHLLRRYARTALATIVDIAALVLLAPHWTALVDDLARPHAWVNRVGADGAAAQLAGAALWCTALWLGVGLAAVLLARTPGKLGALGRLGVRRVLPVTVIRLLAGAVGASILLAPAAAGAHTVTGSGGSGLAVRDGQRPAQGAPAWPSDGRRMLPQLDIPWPTSSAPSSTAGPTQSPVSSQDTVPTAGAENPVVVRAGDSLWSIAASRLGPQASHQAVAAEWPRWYAANQKLIGPDPAALHPGQVLIAPGSSPTGTPNPLNGANS